jgi:ABC-2 type transport system permease protein
MMNQIVLIAADELRYWRRSKIAWSVLLTLVLVSVSAALVSNAELSLRAETRAAKQAEADAIFQAQPDRHPHRMVHYGHYVFRGASPLAAIDPGIDSMVGTSIFLEGHRRNTATFAPAKETGLLARFGSFSPAFALQTLAPLLLIICGFATVTREKENRTLYQLIGQGVGTGRLVTGKFLALWLVAILALLPLIILGLAATSGQAFDFRVSLFTLASGYLLYLSLWILVIVSVSALQRTSSQSLSLLLGMWVISVVLMPRVAGEYAAAALPTPSQTEINLRFAEAMRSEGDSHNIEDEAFTDLRSLTLTEYGVERVEDLPFNYRGYVAMKGEESDTELLNQYTEQRLNREVQQKNVADSFAWLSPAIAMRAFSMALSGTALQDHHYFLREAEDYRYNMVQTFNRLQMTEMTLAEDLARNESAEAGQRTRIDATNWREMPVFDLQPLPHAQRWQGAATAGVSLLVWLLAAIGLLFVAARRIRP